MVRRALCRTWLGDASGTLQNELAAGTSEMVSAQPARIIANAAAAGIGIVNSVGNLGGYVGPNIPIWAKHFSSNPSAALYIIAGILMLGAVLTYLFIPKTLRVRVDPVG